MAAPWKNLFSSHISKLLSPEFSLATIHTTPTGAVPKVRTCIFRGYWAELPTNPMNSAPQNKPVYQSSCLTFTTDVRMDKVPDLFAHHEQGIQGSGGGGDVEACWWVKDAMTQWRVSGKAWVLNERDIDSGTENAENVRMIVGNRMKKREDFSELTEEDQKNWSWEMEVLAHFGNLSPVSRGYFINPWPGKPFPNNNEDNVSWAAAEQKPVPSNQLGKTIDSFDDTSQRENFRVVIIAPAIVEQTFLPHDTKSSRRWRYTLEDADSEKWKIEELWP